MIAMSVAETPSSGMWVLKRQTQKIAEFANTADPDETAHNEPSHLDLQCLPSKV